MTLDAHTVQNKEIIDDVKALKVATFGDKQLKIPGLLDDVADLKKWIMKSRLKIAYAAGIFTAVGMGVKFIWEWISGKH